MVRPLRLFLPIFFMALGIAILSGWILPGLPEGTGIRPMLGMVTILFGLYRGVVFLFVPPQKRRPYGGFRYRLPKNEEKKKTTLEDHEPKEM